MDGEGKDSGLPMKRQYNKSKLAYCQQVYNYLAKKVTAMKKDETKKKAGRPKKVEVKAKKSAEKKVTEEVKDIQLENNEVTVESAPMPQDDKELAMDVMKHVASEILAENGNSLDAIASTPREEVVEKVKEKIEEIKKVNNEKVNKRIDHVFGYLWNGQEMD